MRLKITITQYQLIFWAFNQFANSANASVLESAKMIKCIGNDFQKKHASKLIGAISNDKKLLTIKLLSFEVLALERALAYYKPSDDYALAAHSMLHEQIHKLCLDI